MGLRFCTPTLSRDHCPQCQETTLHKSGRCIHCQHALYEIKPGDNWSWKTQRDYNRDEFVRAKTLNARSWMFRKPK